MKGLDFVAKIAPGYAAKRAKSHREYQLQSAMNEAARLYDAATNTQYRKPVVGAGMSPNAIVDNAGTRLRDLARYLEENHDLTNAIFDDLLNNIIGAGASKVPQIKLANGELATDVNNRALELYDEWAQCPDTTGEFGFEQMERMVARHVFRDGEIFLRPIINNAGFAYKTQVPYAVDMLDADYCPLDLLVTGNNVIQGIECNEWGAPTAYYFYKSHPGEVISTTVTMLSETQRIEAAGVYHLKYVKRLRQRRGVPLIHSVIDRMRDIKDYEESERIAAKVAASMTFAITKSGEASAPTAVNTDGNREFGMAPGMGFELMPGEGVTTIDSNRPNTGLNEFRNAMLRAVAGGTGTRFSSISKDYNGTYSAQRQELVEGSIAYRAHFNYFVRKFYKPIWSDFITAAALSGALGSLRGVDQSTLTRCEFRPPSLPWIDPAKEAKAWRELVDAKLESRKEVMRQRGRDPAKVMEEMSEESENELFASTIDLAEPETLIEDINEDINEDENEAGAA